MAVETTYIGGGIFVFLNKAQIARLRRILRAKQGHDRNWQVFAARPSEALNILASVSVEEVK